MPSNAAERLPMRPRHRGFTLIEVLAALVIVALGMLGVIQAVTQTARNGTYLREKTLAHWIGLNLITERRLQPSPPDVSESSDEVEFAGRRWRWTMRVTQTEVESLRRMDVSVRPADAPDGSALATVTGFYGTAIGAVGGGSLDWAGVQKGAQGGDEPQDNPDDETPEDSPESTPVEPKPPTDSTDEEAE
jgi:general secretion pathway protein I